jgi:hypothetical protein
MTAGVHGLPIVWLTDRGVPSADGKIGDFLLGLLIWGFTQGYWLGVAFWTLVLIMLAWTWVFGVFGVGKGPKLPPPKGSRED